MTRIKFEPATEELAEPEADGLVLRPGQRTVIETDSGVIELLYWPAAAVTGAAAEIA